MANKYPIEHPTLLEKKARLYIIGGVAVDTDQNDIQVFWFAINRYGPLHIQYKEPGVRNIVDYRKKYEPLSRGEEEWEKFMRDLPKTYEEGNPYWYGGKGQWYKRFTPETVVPMTAIPVDIIAPVGEKKRDAQSVRLLISHIREIIWHLPIKGMPYFQPRTTTMGKDVIDELRSRIGPKALGVKNNKRIIMGQVGSLIPIDDMTRYCVVATGQIVDSEDAAISAIENYLFDLDMTEYEFQFPEGVIPQPEMETLQEEYFQPRLMAKLSGRTNKDVESMMDTLEDIYRSLYEKDAVQEAKVLRKIMTKIAVLQKDAIFSLVELAVIFEMGIKNGLSAFELLPVMKGLNFTKWNIPALEKVIKYFFIELKKGKSIAQVINTSESAFNGALETARKLLMRKYLNRRYQEIRDQVELEQVYPEVRELEPVGATLNKVYKSLKAKGESKLAIVVLDLMKKL